MNKIAIVVLGIILLLPVVIASSKATTVPSSAVRQFGLAPTQAVTASPNATAQGNDTVQIVVVGHINMGPMLPTVAAIKEVTSKYGDSVNVTWIDLQTQKGAEYAYEHDLTAHMNVVINGSYEYNVNGKAVRFQWFEGQQWTKDDLDTVISSILSKDNRATPIGNQVTPQGSTGGNSSGNGSLITAVASAAIVIAVIVVAAWFILRTFKK